MIELPPLSFGGFHDTTAVVLVISEISKGPVGGEGTSAIFYLYMVSNQQSINVLQNMLASKAIEDPHKNIPGGLIGVTSSDINGSLLPTWLTALTLK